MYVIGIDLDDTLYCENHAALQAFTKVATQVKNHTSYDLSEIEDFILQRFFLFGRNRLLEDVILKFNVQTITLQELIQVYHSASFRLELYEDALNLLTHFKLLEYPLVLITDGVEAVQQNKIVALNLERYFDKIVITSTLGSGYEKPNTRVFEEVMSEYQVSPDCFVYIGDNPYKDIKGAKAVGAKSVRILRGPFSDMTVRNSLRADITIGSFDELRQRSFHEYFRS